MRSIFRLVSYERFCANPKTELARLMGLIPLPLEAAQLRFAPSGDRNAGDPKTFAKAGGIVVESRDSAVDDIRTRFATHPRKPLLDRVRAIVQHDIGRMPDQTVIDRLTALALKHELS